MITAAIPTYMRGAIAAQTVARLLSLTPPPDEIIVVDQSPESHADLIRWNGEERIRLIRLPQPSIPHAMNVALDETRTPLLLYLDDDIEPADTLVAAHERAHREHDVAAVAGQVLQPWDTAGTVTQPQDDLQFRFFSDRGAYVRNVMAGNLSINVEAARSVGGFDENFIGVAYRFETDFAQRLCATGARIWFEPSATLRHLKLSSGGLRAYGDHRSSPSPAHSVGDYYFGLRHGHAMLPFTLLRLRQNVLTRFHLRHPWTIPTKIIGELRGLLLAHRLAARGPKLLPDRSSVAAARLETPR